MLVLFLVFTGCKKHDHALDITIEQISTAVNEVGTETGTFTTSGEINTSGTFVMEVMLVGLDSFYCSDKLITSHGSFTASLKCSATTNTGVWTVVSGTGQYSALQGGGSLTMAYPPGVVGIETLTGTVFLGR